jgi:ABC-type iron transport system FetAB ATPase subunit
MLKEAGIEANDQNKEKIDNIIHKYIGEQSRLGKCSADWKKAKKEITANEKMKTELITQLKKLS